MVCEFTDQEKTYEVKPVSRLSRVLVGGLKYIKIINNQVKRLVTLDITGLRPKHRPKK